MGEPAFVCFDIGDTPAGPRLDAAGQLHLIHVLDQQFSHT
jgi:hypothetical protein